MLVLAIETSTPRGSVALVDSGRLLVERWHDESQAHGEQLLRLIDDLFKETADRCRPGDLEAIAAGRGPGAFTGLRVGLATAHGLATGLGIPAIGVSTMRAMALGMDAEVAGNRWPILDARRGEFFIACYSSEGVELVAPHAIPKQRVEGRLMELQSRMAGNGPDWLLGRAASLMDVTSLSGIGFRLHADARTDWPGAVAVGRLASTGVERSPITAEYLRDADAVVPNLPPSPLSLPRGD